jgi:hypothetical protein
MQVVHYLVCRELGTRRACSPSGMRTSCCCPAQARKGVDPSQFLMIFPSEVGQFSLRAREKVYGFFTNFDLVVHTVRMVLAQCKRLDLWFRLQTLHSQKVMGI